MNLIKSQQRIADYGEVFTPAWMADAMRKGTSLAWKRMRFT